VSSDPSGPVITGILPARWGSSRFPGKPLHPIAGKPLIRHVWERCRRCRRLDHLLVATDDRRILEAAEGFGARVVMTSSEHPSGTDRLAEAVAAVPETTHVVNIQGDEPLIEPDLVDQLAEAISADPGPEMATAAHPLEPGDPAIDNPDVVKVVVDLDGRALYFSRSPLPFLRGPAPGHAALRHKGIYAYRRDFLERFVQWPPSPLEIAESLEQLRALEHGAAIRVLLTDDRSPGVDTPSQAVEVERLLLRHPESQANPAP